MKIKIENQSSASIPYTTDKKIIAKLDGREYKPMGKSFESRSTGWRFVKVLELVGLIVAGVLFAFTPFLLKRYRKQIKQISKEIKLGQEKIIHVVPFLSIENKKRIKKDCSDKLHDIDEFLKKPYKNYGKIFDKEDPRKDEEVQPVALEIHVNIRIGNNQQAHCFPFKSVDDSPLTKAAIKEHLTKVHKVMTTIIENGQGFHQGSYYSVIYKDHSNEFHLRTMFTEKSRNGGGYEHGKDKIKKTHQNLVKHWRLLDSTLEGIYQNSGC